MPDLLAVVELVVDVGRWPAGTEGTVVEVFDDGILVEVADDEGRTLELLPIPRDAVRVIDVPKQDHLPV